MIGDKPSNSFKDRVFTVLNEIDQKVEKVKKKGIVFVGLTRVGKSTAYNWTIKHPLQAKAEAIKQTVQRKEQVAITQNPGKKIRRRRRSSSSESEALDRTQKPQVTTTVTYEPKIIRTETGQVRSGIKSCTLVPNIVDLSDSISILDMAGYGDTRDYVGTLGVSYSLRAVFQELEQVKFIVVVTESILKDTKRLCETLNHFFGMFDLQTYPDIEDEIFNATSLLVTQSIEYTKYHELIKKASKDLKDPDLKNIDNAELISDFLKYIGREVNRYSVFKMAQLGNPPEECKILEEFDNKGWQYFDLKAARMQVVKKPQDPDIIKLPFEKEYLSLKAPDQKMLMSCIDRRLKSYKRLSMIFAKLYEKIFVEGSINDIKLPYQSFIDEIDNFITQNDHYDSEKYIYFYSQAVPEFFKPQRETLFYLLLKIKHVVNFEGKVIGTSKIHIKPTMDLFRERIVQLIQLVSVIFCRNEEEYKKMLQLRFILLRGIRQFYMLLHVSPQNVSSCVNEIHDNFQFIFPPIYQDYWQKFFRSFDLNHDERIEFGPRNQQNYMERYLRTRENAFATEILFKTHECDILKLNSEAIDQYYQILRDVKLIHARHQFERYEYRKCLIYLHDAITLQMRFQKNYINRLGDQLNQSAVDIMVKIMYTNQENIFDMLKQIFIKMRQLQTALLISKELNWVHSACEIYEMMLAEKGKRNDKETIEEYAIFCMDHGLQEKGRALFHRLLQVEKTFARKKEILRKIQDYLEHPQNSKEAYLKFLKYYFVDLIDERRQRLLSTIGQSFKEENHNIDRIIDIIKQHFDNQPIASFQVQQQEILIQYLQARDNCETFCTANGFRAHYLNNVDTQKREGLPIIVVGNRLELKQLNIRLVQHLQTVSKISKIGKNKQLRIDVEQMNSNGISEKHIIITLDGEQMKRTFEYAVKMMEAIKKLIYQPHYKLLEIISLTRDSIQRTDKEIVDHLFDRYQQSITKEEIQAIKRIIRKMPRESNEGIEAEFRKIYKQPKLVRRELNSIFDYIRLKNCEELYEQVKNNMLQTSKTKDSDADLENTRHYY